MTYFWHDDPGFWVPDSKQTCLEFSTLWVLNIGNPNKFHKTELHTKHKQIYNNVKVVKK